MDTETLNKLSKFKQTLENDRVNICKQIKTATDQETDKSKTLNNSGIISKILNNNKYDVGGLSNYKGIMDKYTCFICTGKYNVKIGEFDILTDNEFKALKMEQYYKDLKKGSSKLEEIDNTIFKGLTNLYKKDPSKRQVSCKEGNYNAKSGICVGSNVYSKLNKKVRTKLDKKKADEINENAIYLLNIKRKLLDRVDSYYDLISVDQAAAVTTKDINIIDLINDQEYFDEYKQYMAFIPDNKKNKFLSIMYSPGKPTVDMRLFNVQKVINAKRLEDAANKYYKSERNKYLSWSPGNIGYQLSSERKFAVWSSKKNSPINIEIIRGKKYITTYIEDSKMYLSWTTKQNSVKELDNDRKYAIWEILPKKVQEKGQNNISVIFENNSIKMDGRYISWSTGYSELDKDKKFAIWDIKTNQVSGKWAPDNYEISLINDYTQERKKMIGDLLKEPFTNYNEFTEGYVNYIKEYGFRK